MIKVEEKVAAIIFLPCKNIESRFLQELSENFDSDPD